MNAISKILSRKGTNIVSVAPVTTVFEALKIMAEKNIGSVIVMENDQYMGIVTERDYSRKVILKEKNSIDTPVSEIMMADLPRVSPQDTVEHCMEIMAEKNLRYLPVFNNERLSGIISMSDIVKQIISLQEETINNLNEYIYSK